MSENKYTIFRAKDGEEEIIARCSSYDEAKRTILRFVALEEDEDAEWYLLSPIKNK